MSATWEAYGAERRAVKAASLMARAHEVAKEAPYNGYERHVAALARLAVGYAVHALTLDRAAALSHCGPRLTEVLHLRARPDQLRLWRRAAQADGRDLSNWVRWVLDREAEKQNKEGRS